MKTRIIQTRFYDDEFVGELDLYGQHLYMYLLTCQYINISGIFQLTPKKIQFESKLTEHQYASAVSQLTPKVRFYKGWVYVINALKNNNYIKSGDNKVAYEKELEKVPEEVLSYFKGEVPVFDSTVDSSVESTKKSEIRNNKSEIRNKKQEREQENTEEVYQDLKSIQSHFNQTFNKRFQITDAWSKNALKWLSTYSTEEIIEAITKWHDNGWWADPDIVLLFRTSNKHGACDYIGELLNSEKKGFVI